MELIKKIILTILAVSASASYANTTTIQVGGFSFTPNAVTVSVGDTVKFMWISGIHTTTSVSLPANAIAWSSPMDSGHTSFSYKVSVAGQYNFQCNFHFLMGMTGTITANPTGIKPVSGSVPDKFELKQNYPNPFNPVTTIKFDISKNAVVKLRIFDLKGVEVATLVKQELQPGSYSVEWDASNYASGVYYYRLEVPGFSESKKLMLLK
jgi:plastocyanin